MHRPRAFLLVPFFTSMLALVLCAGCFEPPPVQLDPTPAPTTVSSGDYRFTALAVLPPDQGFDLDGDGSIDNNFPYMLDELYAVLEAVVLTTLEGQDLNGLTPEQVWALTAMSLEAAGLPISTEAWNAAEGEAVRSATVNFLPYVAVDGSDVNVVVRSGVATPYGYQQHEGNIGTWTGSLAGTDVQTSGGSLVLLYPQPAFNLGMLELHTNFVWTGEGLSDGRIGGGIPLESIINAVLALIPDSITVQGQTIDIPEEAIARQLELFLEAYIIADTGEPLFDLELSTGETAISAGLEFSAVRVQIAAP